jgi:osmotically-inducible protein OsmY
MLYQNFKDNKMNNRNALAKILAVLFILTSTSGCILAAAGAGAEAGYIATQKDKTTGEVIDDQLIVTSIKTQLLANQEVSGLDINVDCDKGVVTLRGHVNKQSELDRAIDIAKGVKGVTGVISKISIQG